MLTTVELENYRGFKRYRLCGLSRVNLLVGKNNCGKTSLLEAVDLLASEGNPEVLAAIARERGEVIVAGKDREHLRGDACPVLAHFFHGHDFGPGVHLSVSSEDGLGKIAVCVEDLEGSPSGEQLRLFEESESRAALAIRVEGGAHVLPGDAFVFPVTEEGAIPPEVLYRHRRVARRVYDESPAVQFISPDSLERRSMSEMWNKVITEGRESEVIDAMRILEPGLTNIFFLSGETTGWFGGRAGILVALEGTRRRHPLGSYGEGMRRLLALCLSLIRCEDGVLLIDEIDTGLHYSIMGDMWRLVVEAAKKASVQVFATTHSSDCVRGLAWLCENRPDLWQELSLQKVDCNLEEAVALDAEQIMLAVTQGMEVR